MLRCNKAELFEGLLDYQFFPAGANNPTQVPPVLVSRGFAKFMANNRNLTNFNCKKDRTFSCDHMHYISMRFDNLGRAMGIAHPQAYCSLVAGLRKNWDSAEMVLRTSSSHSVFRPARRKKDKRIFVMEYENKDAISVKESALAANARFEVKADVKSFFPSIYSHSLRWTIPSCGEDLDRTTRRCQRSETKGILVGSAASNIIAEIILAYVDEMLDAKRSDARKPVFKFLRRIDDYVCYCGTLEECEEFLNLLSECLRLVRLELNSKKTKIAELPTGRGGQFLFDVQARSKEVASSMGVDRFFDVYVDEFSRNPDTSILMYASRTLINNLLKRHTPLNVFGAVEINIMRLCRKYPALMPLLEELYRENKTYSSLRDLRADFFEDMFLRGFNKSESSTMSWSLYFACQFGMNITLGKKQWERLLSLGDGITLTMIFYFLRTRGDSTMFSRFMNTKFLEMKAYELDQLWLLHYQMYFEGSLKEPTLLKHDLKPEIKGRRINRETFKFYQALKREKVSFMNIDLAKSRETKMLETRF